MKMSKWAVMSVVLAVLIMVIGSGCQDPCKDVKAQNMIQQDRISELETALNVCTVERDQIKSQLEELKSKSSTYLGSKDAEIAALEKTLGEKNALIAKMQAQLMHGGVALPMELNIMLQDFAAGNKDMVTFDQDTGMLKFKSDLLFSPGSDELAAGAADSLKSLATIMNSEEGKKFDLSIAGHTDDARISKPATIAKHPTNWHLSAHRAISVLQVLVKNGISSERVNIRGYGEFRPAEENKPNKGGNPANRRVEIYVVPSSV